MSGRHSTDAKNVETAEKGGLWGGGKAEEPSYPGPGANVSAKDPAKPHASKWMNKADPRFNEDLLEETQKKKEEDKKEDEQVNKILEGIQTDGQGKEKSS